MLLFSATALCSSSAMATLQRCSGRVYDCGKWLGFSAGAASIAFSPYLFRKRRAEGVQNASDIAP
jgi:hypothetical protein